jgi:GMP reductase|tara:strand:- start:6343 stop:7410 length:1068 start_codon:yes stop_codon:yes gene_type:complete
MYLQVKIDFVKKKIDSRDNKCYNYSLMKTLKYSEVSLVPNYSTCESRSAASTSIVFGEQQFNLPIVPANMKSVINTDIARWMSSARYFYIMHRFDIDLLDFVTQANKEDWETISISVGVKDADMDLLIRASSLQLRIDYITIDIAHGHSKNMEEAIEVVRRFYPNAYLIAGNVATPQAVSDLSRWGADCVKVGVGQGSPCTTKYKTGFTVPMFTCVWQCGQLPKYRKFEFGDIEENAAEIPIIADGGIKHNGDIAKALTARARMVMAGGIFASCSDSPARTIKIEGEDRKAYFGSASSQNKGHLNHIEGTLKNLPPNGLTYEGKLREIRQDLQSAISYAGGCDLTAFNKVKFEVV